MIDPDGQGKLFPLNVAVEILSGILHRPIYNRRPSKTWMPPFLKELTIRLDPNIWVVG
jgi:hypothetical protein